MARPAPDPAPALEAPPPRTPKTSELLAELNIAGAAEDRLPIGALLDSLGARAQGFAVVVFALAGAVPYPPGVPVPMVCGLVLFLIALQMSPGRRLRLPAQIRARTIARRELRKVAQRMLPWVLRMERLSRPRLQFVFTTSGRAMIRSVVALLAFVMILPIPFFGNTPPGLAIAAIGLGLVQRDGLIVLLGLIGSVAALGVALWALATLFGAMR